MTMFATFAEAIEFATARARRLHDRQRVGRLDDGEWAVAPVWCTCSPLSPGAATFHPTVIGLDLGKHGGG